MYEIYINYFCFQLLDACVNNCGRNFQLEIASRDFETEFRKILQRSQPKVAEKLKLLLKKWAEGDFKTDPQLSLIPSLYNKLKQEGMDFSSDVPVKVRPNTVVIKIVFFFFLIV